ncbi:DUF3892 domain-containing protein [Clostridium sp. BJN0013]|uniref:DUF3892 domain-containing protein n=1 Tax=Clostridium sp. BJN0013 TaxID=3236840 RepID=UPI0034C6797A
MEYGIIKVEYENYNCTKGDAHITKVRVCEIIEGKKFSDNFQDQQIEEVIQNIKNGDKYITLVSTGYNKWKRGSEIILKEFITTKPDTNRGSDLESLPLIPYDIWEL